MTFPLRRIETMDNMIKYENIESRIIDIRGQIEKYGSGIMKIFTICENHGIQPPKFNDFKDGFEVVLYKEKISSKERNTNGELNGKLNEKQKLVYNTIKSKPVIRNPKYLI